MAPPAPSGAFELVPAAAGEEEHQQALPHHPVHDRDVVAKRGGAGAGAARAQPQGAGARIVSVGVQAAVMAAAIAIFLLFAAASALLLLVLVVAARAFRHHRGSRYRVPTRDPSPPPSALRAGLSPADIARLPTFAFPSSSFSSPRERRGDGDGDGEDAPSSSACAVCLEAASAGERWRAMPACRHAFHAACVDRWLARSPACPVCRAAVAVAVPTS